MPETYAYCLQCKTNKTGHKSGICQKCREENKKKLAKQKVAQ